ncbi:hypothetical protein GCM10009738_69950 [Kitasatospora viridis]
MAAMMTSSRTPEPVERKRKTRSPRRPLPRSEDGCPDEELDAAGLSLGRSGGAEVMRFYSGLAALPPAGSGTMAAVPRKSGVVGRGGAVRAAPSP